MNVKLFVYFILAILWSMTGGVQLGISFREKKVSLVSYVCCWLALIFVLCVMCFEVI